MTQRQKILLLGLVAVAAMLLALWLQYRSYAAQSLAIEAMARNVKAVGALSLATHQLQKERGLTAIKPAMADGQALAAQVRDTDAALASLAEAGVGIAGLAESLARLRNTAAGTMTPLAVLDDYSRLIQGLIDEMERLTREPEATVAKADIAAHTHLVAAKEYLGQIRGTLGYWLEHKRNDPLVLNTLIRLRTLQDEELRKFGLDALPELRVAFALKFSGPEVGQALATMTQIAASGRLPQRLDVQTWWLQATAAIDRLKSVEDISLEAIEKKADDELERLRSAMRIGVAAALAAGLAVLVLAVSATASLLHALDRTLASIERIATSQDFQIRLPADAPDEIGRISRSFNRLLDIVERLLTEKEFLAITDPLTGINNRLRFAKVLGEEAERKRRSGTPMALVMFDIDRFKDINDAHGHNVGDEVLKALAALVGGAIRATDFFGRWGGEEFVLLLKDDACDAGIIIAEKLRHLIAAAEVAGIGQVTCSFGVAAWERDDTAASLVARADKALYESKQGGRNRVSCIKGPAGSCRGRAICGQ